MALEDKVIFDIGCGIGTYLGQFQRFSPCVYGIDLDRGRVTRRGETCRILQWHRGILIIKGDDG